MNSKTRKKTNCSNLIESIPKLKLDKIHTIYHPEIKSQMIYSSPKINRRSRNYKIKFDKIDVIQENNTINKTRNSSADNENKNEYNTDNNLSIYNHNNIFDYYEVDKFDTNNTTLLEQKNILSNSLNTSKKPLINKTVRRKKIINLKSFLNKAKNNKKYINNKFLQLLEKIYNKLIVKFTFKKLVKYHEENIFYTIDKEKLKNLEEKIQLSSRDININKNNEINDIIITNQIKELNSEPYRYNNACDTNSENNYFFYIEQLSSRYHREREEMLNKYRPTNISFVINNFVNNNIFDNVEKNFELIKEFSKANSKKQIKIYKKYYGNIEAINEEENESEELKNLLSSRRNEDNSLNNGRDINNTSSFSIEESISPNPKTNKKFKYFHKYIKNNKKKLYKIKTPIIDSSKTKINLSYIHNQENKIENEFKKQYNINEIDNVRSSSFQNKFIYINKCDAIKSTSISKNNKLKIEKLLINLIILFLFVVGFLYKNLK